MKKRIPTLLAGLCLTIGTLSAPVQAASSDVVHLLINGKPLSTEGKLIEGRTMVPLRAVSEQLGLNVNWEGSTKKITLTQKGKNIILQINQVTAQVNGHKTFTDSPPVLIHAQTFVPIRFVSENIGCEVGWDGATRTVSIHNITENPIEMTNEVLNRDAKHYVIDVQYPQVHGLADVQAEQQINKALQSYGAVDVAQAAKKAEEAYADVSEFMPDFQYGLTKDYQIKYNQKDFLSFLMTDYEYSGGAHGLYAGTGYTFNVKTGKLYSLKDLFKSNVDYIQLVNQEIKKQLQTQKKYDWQTPLESIKPDQNFFLSNDGLVIFFGLYEYTPYVNGEPQFIIPFKTLQNSLAVDLS